MDNHPIVHDANFTSHRLIPLFKNSSKTPLVSPQDTSLVGTDDLSAAFLRPGRYDQLLATTLARLQDMVIILEATPTDYPGPRMVYVNAAVLRQTGYEQHELIGQPPAKLFGPQSDKQEVAKIWYAMEHGEATDVELLNYTKSGKAYWVHSHVSPVKNQQGEVTHWIAIKKDITEQKDAEKRATKLAYFDALTNLPNRQYLTERLKLLLKPGIQPMISALIFLDLDDFKIINDTLGHSFGDDILRQVSNRLKKTIRNSDLVIRLGGDEFVILLESIADNRIDAAQRADYIANKILEACGNPYKLKHGEYYLTPSMGIALLENGTTIEADDLLKHADIAMYEAKAAGKNTVRHFETAMEADINKRFNTESQIREGIDNDQFILHYQPQVYADGRLLGYEALIRWQHPEQGLLGPIDFIDVAEESGLIHRLGQFVLLHSCRQAREWMDAYPTNEIYVSVNISPRQFYSATFVQEVVKALDLSGLCPWLLRLELTENMMLRNIADTAEKMSKLKDIGVNLSLDDFGTGFSSLYYLKSLPISEIKIDKSFVDGIPDDTSDLEISRLIINLSKHLGMRTIAEGVENARQHEILMDMGCDSFQGYYFGKPAAANALCPGEMLGEDVHKNAG